MESYYHLLDQPTYQCTLAYGFVPERKHPGE